MTSNKENNHKKHDKAAELTADLQRLRADFENYRKHAETDKQLAKAQGKIQAIYELLPVVDNLERALGHMPPELSNNAWASGIQGVTKQLDKMLEKLSISRINAQPGSIFDPHVHEAIQADDREGDQEVVAEELQAGYKLGDDVIRPAMVKVTHR